VVSGFGRSLTRYRYERTLTTQGWKWGAGKLLLSSYTIPIAYVSVVYIVVWVGGFGHFFDRSFLTAEKTAFGWTGIPDSMGLLLYVGIVGTVGIVPSSATALGEEIGWRGFLVPELAKVTSFTKVALLSGFGWAMWHYPLFLFADYGAGMPKLFSMTCFTISVVGLSFLYAWMRLASGTVWTAVLLTQLTICSLKTFSIRSRLTRGRLVSSLGNLGSVLHSLVW
jgi:membrane protease YdiL (CAAX protease family)